MDELKESVVCGYVKNTQKVIVLTDLDRRGNKLGRIIKFKHFEEISGEYIKFLEEIKNIN